ncbi:MAG: cobalamin biosynthesis protein CobW [Rhodospirillales bacterium]
MKIPATVITGFLGAGKTTLIRHLLENANGARLALIVNEFGDLGIDKELIQGCGIDGCEDDDVIELANGCICCTVADDFLPTIERLLDRPDPPDHIVIEASGLALPKPLVKAFTWPEVRSRVTVDGVIAVVDAPAVADGRFADDPDAVDNERLTDPALDHDRPLQEVFEDQLSCADLVLLNKGDLVDAPTFEAVSAGIGRVLPPVVKVVASVQSAVDPRVVLGLGAAAEDAINGRSSHHDSVDDHDHDDFESFVVSFGAVADPAALAARIEAVTRDHDVLRVKGFVTVEAKDMRHVVQAVGPRVEHYYDRPWRAGEERRSALVVIGETGLDRAAIERVLKA